MRPSEIGGPQATSDSLLGSVRERLGPSEVWGSRSHPAIVGNYPILFFKLHRDCCAKTVGIPSSGTRILRTDLTSPSPTYMTSADGQTFSETRRISHTTPNLGLGMGGFYSL